MKKHFLFKTAFLLTLSFYLLFSSCKKKKFDDALPVVTLESAEMVSLDSVALIGHISSEGADDIEYFGFAFSKTPSFTLLTNQVLFEGSETGNFRTVVHAEHDSTFYFQAFAANGFGYKASNIIKYKVLSPPPVVAPCPLTNNYFNDDGASFPVTVYGSSVSPNYGNYSVYVYGGSETIRMYFPYKPIDGIYTTTSNGSNIGPGQVFINITNFYQYYVDAGGKVYVNVDSLGTTSVSICGVQYIKSSISCTLRGKGSFN
jgi:hypothetical protein